MPSATALTQAIAHYAPQLQAMGVHPVDVLLRLDAKGSGVPCGDGWISRRKKCSSKGSAKLKAALKAGDKRALARVAATRKKVADRNKLKREVAEDRPLRKGGTEQEKAIARDRLKKRLASEKKNERGNGRSSGRGNDGGDNSNGAARGAERAGQGKPAPAEHRITTARADITPKADHSKIPERLQKHLSGHQKDGVALAVAAMDSKGGFLIADGTGVGKTREQLAVAAIYAEQGKKVLMVTKAEVIKPDWKKEKVSGSFESDAATMGIKPRLTRGEKPLKPGEVGLTTYDNLGKIKGQVDKDTVLILDEAHSLKNWQSQRTKHGSEMIKNAGSVLYATATPADQPLQIGYLSRAGVFNGNSPKQVFEWMGMRQEEIHVGGGMTKKVWGMDKPADEVYHRMTGLFDQMTENGQMIKREISLEGVDVAFQSVKLPKAAYDKMEETEMAVLHAAVAESAKRQRISIADTSSYKSIKDLAENGPYTPAIAKLYQEAENDGLTKARILMAQRRQLEPFKIDATIDEAKAAVGKGNQVVIFASRVNDSGTTVASTKKGGKSESLAGSEGTMKTLKAKLKAAGIPESEIAEIHGGQTKSKVAKGMKDFQNGRAKVVIATVEAGGTGINLDDTKGDAPRTMLMMTPPFNAVDNVQAAGRVWRMSTKSTPEIKYITSDAPVDQWNRALVSSKMSALKASIQGEVGKLDKWKEEDKGPAPRPPSPPKAMPGKLRGSEKQINWASSIRDQAFSGLDRTIAVLKDKSPDVAAQYETAREKLMASMTSSRDWIDGRDDPSGMLLRQLKKEIPNAALMRPSGDGKLRGSEKQVNWAETIKQKAEAAAISSIEKLEGDQRETAKRLLPKALNNITSASDWIDSRNNPLSAINKEMSMLIEEEKIFGRVDAATAAEIRAIGLAIEYYRPRFDALGIDTNRVLLETLWRLDAKQSPKNKFGNKKPGIPCGKAYISWRKKCSEDKAKAATARLKGTAEGKAYAERVRKSKGLKPGGAEVKRGEKGSGKKVKSSRAEQEKHYEAISSLITPEGKDAAWDYADQVYDKYGADHPMTKFVDAAIKAEDGIQKSRRFYPDGGDPHLIYSYSKKPSNLIEEKLNDFLLKEQKYSAKDLETLGALANEEDKWYQEFKARRAASQKDGSQAKASVGGETKDTLAARNQYQIAKEKRKEAEKSAIQNSYKRKREGVTPGWEGKLEKLSAPSPALAAYQKPRPKDALKTSQKSFMLMNGKELKEYATTLGITASGKTNRQLAEALERKTGKRSPRADACACEEPKRKLKRSRLVKLLKLDARKCSPPWRGTLGSCTRGAEASSKRSIANIARGGKMSPERKARQERIAKLKSKGPSKTPDITLESLMSGVEKANSAFDKTAKKAREISKKGKQPETLEENLKAVAKARSIVRQEKLAGAAQGQIDRLKKLGGDAKNEAEERAKLEKLAIEAPKQVKRFKRAKKRLEELKAKQKAENTKKALRIPREGRKQRARTQNAIRRFNRKADAMGWSTAVRMDAIAYLLEVLG